MTTSLSDAHERLEHVTSESRQLYGAVQALRELVADDERQLVFLAKNFSSVNLGDAQDLKAPAILLSRGHGLEAAARNNLLTVLENSPDFIQAKAAIEPLLAEISDLEASELQDRIERDQKREQLRVALEKAKLDAENAPTVVAARKALEAAGK
jgi:predicted O-linked N-acetylglucosamine transferase (SPINDLY family)